ncbi:MAG: F0F1 ATP synthase subunit A [Planctomycetota bacterium]|nr:F0F1 ATP synthase subunit A [Planctomycetota bacterium]MDA1263386.1 F0F1 ATP synthase subunit A [Planctomycetota bacterium]
MSVFLASGSDPISHIVDKGVFGLSLFDNPIMLSMITLFVCAIALYFFMHRAAKSIATGPVSMGNRRFIPAGSFAALVEVVIVYLRNEMLIPVMGERLTKRYLSFLLSLFFFILALNIVGLIPFVDIQDALYGLMGKKFDIQDHETAAIFGGAATASISVTSGLALISFIVIQFQGFRELGVKGWLEHLCGGHELVHGPIFLWLVIPIVFFVEFFGLFVKPAALAIRLFANMVAGHTLLITLTMFGAMAIKAGLGTFAVGGITIVSGIGAILITFLEVFVAVLQAFIFMFLTAVFISLMAHEEGEEHSDHAIDDGHAASAMTAAH